MTTLTLDIQAEIYTKLSGNAGLMAAVSNRVYDNVLQDSPFPFISIGEDVVTSDSTDDEPFILDVSVTVDVWSRARGRKECKEIMDLVIGALHRQSFVVSGNNIVNCELIQSQSFLDQDGLTRHGVVEFLFIIEEVL